LRNRKLEGDQVVQEKFERGQEGNGSPVDINTEGKRNGSRGYATGQGK